MKIHYIDAENVGLNVLDSISMSVLDRCFVFTNLRTESLEYANPLINIVSQYPTGKDQADFCMVAHLVRVLSHLSKEDKKSVEFYLYTKDQALLKAFEFQCELAGSKVLTPCIDHQNAKPEQAAPLLEQKILKFMSSPIKASEIQKQINVSQGDFTRSFNALIHANKIKRQEVSKKHWVVNQNK